MSLPARRLASRIGTVWPLIAGCWVLFAGPGAWSEHLLDASSAHAKELGDELLPAPEALDAFKSQIRPMLDQYCSHCHSGDDPAGKLDLDVYQDGAGLVKDHSRWATIAERLRSGDMPPEGEERPDDTQIEPIASWIERQVAAAEFGRVRDPGRVTMRRLNRVEYNNTIRDLIGLDFHPSREFPTDDVGYGFDNNGDVLSLPPLLMEKYLAAAQTIAEAAIVTHPQTQVLLDVIAKHTVQSGDGRSFNDTAWKFSGHGALAVELPIVAAGKYRVLVKAFGQQAGPDPARMELKTDGRSIAVVDVTAIARAPETYEVVAELHSGKQQLSIEFINDYYSLTAPVGQRDRNLVIETIRVESVVGSDGALPDTHRRIIFRDPAPGTESETAHEIFTRFATRAFRRPVESVEVDRLLKLYELALSRGDSFNDGIALGVQAVLVSPQFLFRLELDPPPAADGSASGDVRALTDYEVASRLSYFLWSSMPDDVLFSEAAAGRLHEPVAIAAQARRMLADGRSRAFVESFTGQWLQLRRLDELSPDKQLFPDYDRQLAHDMGEETERFFAAIITEDRSVLDFLDANFTFVNQRLARLYNLPGVEGTEFRRVELEPGQRGGILTHGSILTLTSNPNRTSPVKRGKWVLENLLGAAAPPPPPDVPALVETKRAIATDSLRKRIEQHRNNAQCASCHARMDPIGFGLENYNAIGAWRNEDDGFPIDASGTLAGQKFASPAELKERLRGKSAQFTRCLAGKLLTYALGRGLESYDRVALAEVVSRTTAAGFRFSSLIEAVVESDPFLKCRTTGTAP
jgi:mono/diheme cytochrome c family protein